MSFVELSLKKKGKQTGEPIYVNTDHIVYYRKYESNENEELTAVFTASKMLVVLESIDFLNDIFKEQNVTELCLPKI